MADQLVEQALLLGVVGGGVLGVPLGADDPAGAVELDGVDDAVGVAADDAEAVAETVEGLMVHAVAPLRRFRAHRLGDP